MKKQQQKQQLERRMQSIKNNDFLLIDNPRSSSEEIRVLCKKCNKQLTTTVNEMFLNKTKCKCKKYTDENRYINLYANMICKEKLFKSDFVITENIDLIVDEYISNCNKKYEDIYNFKLKVIEKISEIYKRKGVDACPSCFTYTLKKDRRRYSNICKNCVDTDTARAYLKEKKEMQNAR